jgi:hypothetical protein
MITYMFDAELFRRCTSQISGFWDALESEGLLELCIDGMNGVVVRYSNGLLALGVFSITMAQELP